MPRPALLLGLLLVAGCVGGRGPEGREDGGAPPPAPLDLRREHLVGTWHYRYAAQEGLLLDVWVSDSMFTVDTPFDTVFAYWYQITDGALLFDDRQGTVTRVGVEKRTADSLVLRDLPFSRRFRMARGAAP